MSTHHPYGPPKTSTANVTDKLDSTPCLVGSPRSPRQCPASLNLYVYYLLDYEEAYGDHDASAHGHDYPREGPHRIHISRIDDCDQDTEHNRQRGDNVS